MEHVSVRLNEEELWYLIGGLHKYIQHCGEAIKRSPMDQDLQIDQLIDTIQRIQQLKERLAADRMQILPKEEMVDI